MHILQTDGIKIYIQMQNKEKHYGCFTKKTTSW